MTPFGRLVAQVMSQPPCGTAKRICRLMAWLEALPLAGAAASGWPGWKRSLWPEPPRDAQGYALELPTRST